MRGPCPLTGQGRAIHAANALFRPDLGTLEHRLAYMRFDCGAIRGEQRFLVVDGSNDLPWRDDADPAWRAQTARLIRPLGLATDAAGFPPPLPAPCCTAPDSSPAISSSMSGAWST